MNINTLGIQEELERVLASRCFRSRKMLGKFLRYIVRATLTENPVKITQHSIAVEGLGKHADFDNTDNPLVRVQAGRLRKQLEDYYLTEGRFNPLRITLPSGSYQPVFTPHASESPHYPSTPEEALPISQGPGIVCVPRSFVQDEATGWPFILRLGRDYAELSSRFNFCQMMFAEVKAGQQATWPDDAWQQYGADFALFLDLHSDNRAYNLKCSLVHSLTRQIIWAHSFPLGESYPDPAMLTPIFRRIANDTLNYERGLAQDFWARQLLASGKPVPAYQQVVLALRQHQWVLTAPQFRNVLRTCGQRLEQFPDDVQAMLVYADMYRNEYLQKFNEMSLPISYLAEFIDTLLQLAPDNAYSHMYLAGFHLLTGEHEQCLQALANAQAINPLDTHLNVTTGLIYMGLGEWQTGANYIQDCIDLSPIYADWYHIPLCVHHYRAGHYAAALKEASKIRLKIVWGPLLRSVLYQRNDQSGKAGKELGNLAQHHPDFNLHNRHLAQGFTPTTNQVVKQLLEDVPSNTPPESSGKPSADL